VYITPKDGATPIYVAAQNGHTDAMKELIAAGCDINVAAKVKQKTRLALALPLRAFRARLPLAPLATLNFQYLFRLLLEA
jgi:ankyrin repeat protein